MPITSETKFSLPTTVTPGEKIPSTKVTVVNDFTGLIGSAEAINAIKAEGSAPDLATTYLVNNKPISSPLNNVTAPLATIPKLGQKWFDTATGTTSALTVPQGASGDIIVDGPQQFTIESTLTVSTAGGGTGTEPTALACTQVAGQDLTLARVHVDTAGITQVDATPSYMCDIWDQATVPTDGTTANNLGQLTNLEIQTAVPSAVSPGDAIPTNDVTMTGSLTGAFASLQALSRSADTLTVALPDAALTVDTNDQTSTSALTDITATPTTVGSSGTIPFDNDATTSAITVPADADGSITLGAPEHFEADLTMLTTAGDTNGTFGMECTAEDGEDLTLATIPVIQSPAHATLTAASPKSSVFGNAVTVPVGTSVPSTTPKPAPAGGTQTTAVQKNYLCSVWLHQTSVPTDGTLPAESGEQTSAVLATSLPSAVNPGATIPAASASLTWSAPIVALNTGMPAADIGGVDQVSVPDYAISASGQTKTLPVTNLATSALTPIPANATITTTWPVESDGTTSPITVPTNAKSDVMISSPAQFTILFTLEPNAAGTAAGDTPVPVAMQCTNADPLTLATIRVVRPLPAITHPVPTGKVLIMRGSKGVAQGTLKNGKANVVIPGTALPVGKNTLTVKYTGDSNTLAATPKTITVVKTKTSPTLAVHVTPGKVAAGAIFPTVNVKLSGPGSAKGGKITVTAGTVHKTATLLFDGTTSVQLPPFATAGHKLIKVAYAGNANFVAKTVTAGLNVTKTGLGKFVVKVKPGKIVAKKTRATLLITLGAPDKLNHGLVTVRLAGHVIAKKVITGTGKITLPKFPSAGRKLLHLTFAGNGSVVARTITKPLKVTKAPKHHRK